VAVKIGASTRIDPVSLARFLATRPALGGEPPQLRQARERRRRRPQQ
jgi:hypothetical protein